MVSLKVHKWCRITLSRFETHPAFDIQISPSPTSNVTHPAFLPSTTNYLYHFTPYTATFRHRQLKASPLVRSGLFKQLIGRQVLGLVTTWESLLWNVFFVTLHQLSPVFNTASVTLTYTVCHQHDAVIPFSLHDQVQFEGSPGRAHTQNFHRGHPDDVG